MNHSHSQGQAASDSSMDNSNVEAKHNEVVTRQDTSAQLDSSIRAWTVVAGAWCCLFVSFGWVNGE